MGILVAGADLSLNRTHPPICAVRASLSNGRLKAGTLFQGKVARLYLAQFDPGLGIVYVDADSVAIAVCPWRN